MDQNDKDKFLPSYHQDVQDAFVSVSKEIYDLEIKLGQRKSLQRLLHEILLFTLDHDKLKERTGV